MNALDPNLGKEELVDLLRQADARLADLTPNDRPCILWDTPAYQTDGLFSFRNCDFINEEKFAKAYAAGKATGSWGRDIQWRVHVVLWAASIGAKLEGDFVECGVNKGGLSKSAVEYLDFFNLDKTFYLLDTYEGLVGDLLTEEEKASGLTEGGYEPCYEHVEAQFAAYPNTRIVKGAVPGTLSKVTSEKIAYLSIDMNCVEPEIAAANFFWPKLSSGAVVVLDDYGWRGREAQKLAFDQFAAEKNVPLLSLPTGQALMIKPE